MTPSLTLSWGGIASQGLESGAGVRLTGVQVLGAPGSRQGTALLAAAAAAAAAADPRASDVQPAQAPSQVCLFPPAPPMLSPQISTGQLQLSYVSISMHRAGSQHASLSEVVD